MASPIMVQGEVTNLSSNSPIVGVKVITRQEGTEIQQETDNNGKFTFHLLPGLWRITVRTPGFNEPDAYMYNFTSDTTGIDFRLQEGYSLSGLVIKEDNGKPAPGVIVEAEATLGGKTIVKQELTDANGRFRFSGLAPGDWQVRGNRGEGQTSQEMRTVGPDAYNVNLTLLRQMAPLDWQWGMGFVAALCILLCILIGIYLWAHRRYAPGPEPELITFMDQVEQTRSVAAEIKGMEEVDDSSLQTLRSAATALKEDWTSVSNTILSLTDGQNEQINILVSRAETAATADNPQDVEAALVTLQSAFKNPRSNYFWSQPPSNYLEVLFWSLAGILVSLLVTNGYYLRRKSFYAEGIWMHVSHLLSVPLLALVVVFLISQIKLNVQIGDSQMALDVSDPRLLAAISFVIAVRPWGMIDFVREAGRRFFGQLRRSITDSSE